MTSFTDRLMHFPRFSLEGKRAIKPGFDRIEVLLAAMDHPESTFDSALVAGTNGKGSTSSMMAAYLTSAGYRTGLHTSPHLLKVTERMRVDGVPAPDEWLEKAAARYFADFESVGASFFEATVVLSLLWFAEQKVSHAVVEVGLGGRLDATNVLSANVSVITGVALDHTDILGDNIEAIAMEKAGIIKPGKPVILGRMPQEAGAVVRERAMQLNAPLFVAADQIKTSREPGGLVRFEWDGEALDQVEMALSGPHQLGNAASALCALQKWIGALNPDQVRNALKNVGALSGLRGRTEVVSRSPFLMLDVAHNPDAVGAALSTFNEQRPSGVPAVAIIGLLSDKDVDGVGALLASQDLTILTVPTEGVRGLVAEALAERLRRAGAAQVHPYPDVKSALREALKSNHSCLALGSHLVVAEAVHAVSDGSFGQVFG